MDRLAVTVFGYTFSHAKLEMILAVIGSLFGLLLLWGVVTRTRKLIITGLIVVAVCFLWWYGMTNGWLDGKLGPPA